MSIRIVGHYQFSNSDTQKEEEEGRKRGGREVEGGGGEGKRERSKFVHSNPLNSDSILSNFSVPNLS